MKKNIESKRMLLLISLPILLLVAAIIFSGKRSVYACGQNETRCGQNAGSNGEVCCNPGQCAGNCSGGTTCHCSDGGSSNPPPSDTNGTCSGGMCTWATGGPHDEGGERRCTVWDYSRCAAQKNKTDCLAQSSTWMPSSCTWTPNAPPPPPPTATPTITPTPTTSPGGTTSCPLTKGNGDADCNGVIDLIDYSIWLNNQCHPGANQVCADTRADFNGDHNVDDTDYNIWKTHYTA